jgi:lipopolysaccharide/colanic/teichoic acid biosynthesis glycosyltransferase
LDELPQLLNILLGEMSFVGPRPILICEEVGVSEYHFMAKPGLTGPT